MRVAIVDDDEMARVMLLNMCEQLENLVVSGVCASAIEVIDFLAGNKVDVMLLDVDMPGLNGLEFIKSQSRLPQVILTTGSKDHAIEAFELHVTDYLHKPFPFPRFVKAIDRARYQMKCSKENQEIYVKVQGRLLRLELKEVSYIEAFGDYAIFHRTNQEQVIIHSTLKDLEVKINSPHFVRIHRSFIVNTSKIVDIQDTNLVIDKQVLPISRLHKDELFKQIKIV